MRRPDLTVLAIPAFVGAMAAEVLWQRRHPAPPGTTRAGDYELADTIASLTMGVGSLVAPFVSARLLDPVTPGRGRYAKVLMGAAVAASAATTVADVRAPPPREGGLPDAGTLPGRATRERHAPARMPCRTCATRRSARRVTGATAVAAVAPTALTVATTWSAQTSGTRLFGLHAGATSAPALAANAVAILGWDFIYYWNHRFMHESRWLWAIHVVHHSSERYNLSTALRQPVAEGLTMSVPYGLLALVGVRPERHRERPGAQPDLPVLDPHRGDRSRSAGSRRCSTPRRTTGCTTASNRQYLDRNHGSILIVWDRLFGTFEREDERGRLRPDQEHRHLQPGPHRHPRVARHRPRRRRRRRPGASGGRSCCAGRAGPTTAAPRSSARPSPRTPSPPDAARRPGVALVSFATIRVSLRHTGIA